MKTDSNIAEVMSRLLNPTNVQKKASIQGAEDAVASLSAASEILDNMGLFVFAEAATQVMERVPSALEKNAQAYGHGVEKYIIETLYDGLMAIRSNMSDIRAEEDAKPRLMREYIDTDTHVSVTDKEFEYLHKLEEAIGKVQTHLESGDASAEPNYDLLYALSRKLYEFASRFWSNIKSLVSDEELAKEGLPPALIRLKDVTELLGMKNYAALERRVRREEEEGGKDYDEPTVEFEQFKEHGSGGHRDEEESMIEAYDEYWDDDARTHPDHPLYRD